MIEKVLVNSDNYCIENVTVNGMNIIKPWGIETADSWAFFTQEWQGYRNNIVKKSGKIEKNSFHADFTVQMREGKWQLKIFENWDTNEIFRSHELTCLEDSWFMDFVSRYVFTSEAFHTAEINDKTIPLQDNYKNYQYPVNKIKLSGNDFNANITLLESESTEKFNPVMYVRVDNGCWVVHARLFPKVFDKKIIKKCRNVKMATPIPHFLSKLLLSIPPVYNRIWYAGEKGNWDYNYHGFGLVHLAKGTKLKLRTKVSVLKS